MFRCCLCGKEYELEKDVVKCVNRCGRQKQADGVFQPKNSKYSGETASTSFCFDIDVSDSIKNDITKILDDLIEAGAPRPYITGVRNSTFKDWDSKTDEEKAECYGNILMISGMYKKGGK